MTRITHDVERIPYTDQLRYTHALRKSIHVAVFDLNISTADIGNALGVSSRKVLSLCHDEHPPERWREWASKLFALMSERVKVLGVDS